LFAATDVAECSEMVAVQLAKFSPAMSIFTVIYGAATASR
jgi:hypothetical protein